MSDRDAKLRERAREFCFYCVEGWPMLAGFPRPYGRTPQHAYPPDYRGMMAGLGPQCRAERAYSLLRQTAEEEREAEAAKALKTALAQVPGMEAALATARAEGERAGCEAERAEYARKIKQAEKLCEIYFEIAATVIGEDAVRMRRDDAIAAAISARSVTKA